MATYKCTFMFNSSRHKTDIVKALQDMISIISGEDFPEIDKAWDAQYESLVQSTVTTDKHTYQWYISDEFDGNHMLHVKRDDGFKACCWWGSVPPTAEDLKPLDDMTK